MRLANYVRPVERHTILLDQEGVTQENFVDTLGLSNVHVNRVLQTLGCDGLISLRYRRRQIPAPRRFREIAEFEGGYGRPQQEQHLARSRRSHWAARHAPATSNSGLSSGRPQICANRPRRALDLSAALNRNRLSRADVLARVSRARSRR